MLKYEDINEAKYVVTEFKLYDDDIRQTYIATYDNIDFISYSNYVFINKNIFYNFEKDIKNLKIVISFRMVQNEIIKYGIYQLMQIDEYLNILEINMPF